MSITLCRGFIIFHKVLQKRCLGLIARGWLGSHSPQQSQIIILCRQPRRELSISQVVCWAESQLNIHVFPELHTGLMQLREVGLLENARLIGSVRFTSGAKGRLAGLSIATLEGDCTTKGIYSSLLYLSKTTADELAIYQRPPIKPIVARCIFWKENWSDVRRLGRYWPPH